MTSPPLYNLSFTAASLRPELAGILAEHYLDSGSWDETKEWALSTNALQCSSATSSNRLEREIRPRLQTLTADQLELLSQSGMDSKTALSWLAAVKKSPFLFDFSSELLRNKLEVFDVTLRPSDYENFIEQHTSQQSQLADISESSLDKLRRVLLRMLREVGILGEGPEFGTLSRPVIPSDVFSVIIADHPKWLAAFLAPDHEISSFLPAS